MTDVFKWVRLLPITAGAVVVVWLLIATNPFGQQLGADINGNLLVGYKLALVCAVAFAVVVILRFGLVALGGADSQTAVSNPDIATRNRIAPVVIGIGTAGIVTLGLAVMVAVTFLDHDWDGKNVLSVFSTVVPVFSTWVGGGIAFYFTNESYRTAAEASGPLRASGSQPITDGNRMIPYEKITKLVLGTTVDGEVLEDPNKIKLATVEKLMKGDTISRVVTFDEKKRPLLVIRRKLYDAADPLVPTIAEYKALNDGKNGADAINFKMLPATATVEDGRRTLTLYQVADIFISDRGGADEPVQGWATDGTLA
jgi:hypothetical protein